MPCEDDFHVIIPARYHSRRFPGKLLQGIQGVTIIERVYRQALLAEPKSITIATDHQEIADHVKDFAANVIMTSSSHESGTDRIAEAARHVGFSAEAIIVNVQGDEPFIKPALIKQTASALALSDAPMATLCWPLESLQQLHNPHVVKVVRSKDNKALYFSRSPIPACRDKPESIQNCYRHIGLYAYRAAFLQQFTALPSCELETLEALEQLRVLWSGYSIQVEDACEEPLQDINTPEDLEACLKFRDTYP